MRILVTTDHFRVGGRETYLATYLGALTRSGHRFWLLASSVHPRAPGLECFQAHVGAVDAAGTRWPGWLRAGASLIDSARPDVIWAHHFDLLPAWLLSRRHGVPLLTTFHGPPVDAGRPNDPEQALGMTLATHRGDGLSGVSEEILDALASLDGASEAHRLANCVPLVDAPPAASPARRWVLIARPEKQDHIRQGVLFLSAYRRRVRGASLDLIIARTPDDALGMPGAHSSVLAQGREMLRHLGARWCLEQGVRRMLALRALRFRGFAPDPSPVVARADGVIGMGRVVLEALAHGRPALLAGYHALHGPVDADRFDALAYSNLSGRGVPETTPERSAELMLDASTRSVRDDRSLAERIDVARWSPVAAGLLERVANARVDAEQTRLADGLCQMLEADGERALAQAFARASEALERNERASLYRFGAG